MQKFKEKERNSIVNARNHNKDEYRCVTHTSFGGLIRSAPTFIQIAGECNIIYMNVLNFFLRNLEYHNYYNKYYTLQSLHMYLKNLQKILLFKKVKLQDCLA